MPRPIALALALAAALTSSCGQAQSPAAGDADYLGPVGIEAGRFPEPSRPVAPVVSDRWQNEDVRERVGEAARVMEWMSIRPGMTVADIGAGAGYYTAQLSARVGAQGRVLAQDVVPEYLVRLRQRAVREGWTNVSVGLGAPGDPRLPPLSTDAALLVHMYHEIERPYALMANLIPALRPGARVGIVDVDDATTRHGTPRALLTCEMAALGYRQVALHWLVQRPPRSEYLAVFEAPAAVPDPAALRPCSP